MTNRALENGVFRPREQLKLAEGTVVDLQVTEEAVDVRALVPPGTDEALSRSTKSWAAGSRADNATLPKSTMSNNHELAFLDTVGLIAVWDKADQWQSQIFQRIGAGQLCTSPGVSFG